MCARARCRRVRRRVEELDRESALAKHRSRDRAGSAAIVQPRRTFFQPVRERLDELRDEPSVAWVVHIVLVVQVVLELAFRRGQVLNCHQGREAGGAALVPALIDGGEIGQLAFTANAADSADTHDEEPCGNRRRK